MGQLELMGSKQQEVPDKSREVLKWQLEVYNSLTDAMIHVRKMFLRLTIVSIFDGDLND